MTVTARPIPILSDNYAWFLRDESLGAVAVVDPADADAVAKDVLEHGGRLDLILLTHHHDDHIAGVDALRTRFECPVAGHAKDAARLPKLDIALFEDETVTLGEAKGRVIETPGHTRGHIAFHFGDDGLLFCGDTLFSLGCGRLLEGTAEEMFVSLRRLAALPGETLVCCGHEYTESNARFALTVEPENAALRARAEAVRRLRAAGQATVPSRIEAERQENPFIRAPDAARLAEIRAAKDRF